MVRFPAMKGWTQAAKIQSAQRCYNEKNNKQVLSQFSSFQTSSLAYKPKQGL